MISGVMGLTEGFRTNQTQITEDNDGRFTDSYCNGVVDLTHVMSKIVGRQLSQMANYRVSYIGVELRNVDDTVDNDNAILVGGDLEYLAPHKKSIDALQSLRTFMRDESQHTSEDDMWRTADKNYRGLRFGWDGDTLVEGNTGDATSDAFDSNALNLDQALDRYNTVTGGFPSAEGYDDSGHGQALWAKRAPVYTSKIPFTCSLQNPERDADAYNTTPQSKGFVWQANYPQQAISVMGGLIAVNLKHGNTDTAGVVEDEYELIVSVGVEGWGEF